MWENFEDFEEEDAGCLDNFFTIENGCITFQFPDSAPGKLTMDQLRMLVKEPFYIDMLSESEGVAETWKVILPEMLKRAEIKQEMYKNLGFNQV
jgi:hypothetical protein